MSIKPSGNGGFPLIALTTGLILLLSIVAARPGDAEASEWARCGEEGGTCTMSKSGHNIVRFGASGRFMFLDVVGVGRIACNRGVFGDPSRGDHKFCDWREAPPTPAELSWTLCGQEGGICTLPDDLPRLVSYGDGTRAVWKVQSTVSHCSAHGYPDVAQGVSKVCHYANTPYLPADGKFSSACTEYSTCVVQDEMDLKLVRFGTGKFWEYKLAAMGTYGCDNDTFWVDRAPGQTKFCEYADAPASNVMTVGAWTQVDGCMGCTKLTRGVTAGITGLRAKTVTQQWSASVEFAYKKEVLGTGPSGKISSTIGGSEAIQTSLARTDSVTSTVDCPGGANASAWQWKVDVDDDCWATYGSCKSTVSTMNILCVVDPPANFKPVCAPGTATDKFALNCR